MKSPTTIVGACGEHYVASYLSGNNLIVAMPRAGVPGCDLIVAKVKGGTALRIQVKTGTLASKKNDRDLGPIYLWRMSESAVKRNDKNLWYAFVWLRDWPEGEDSPEVFFVPSRAVVNCVRKLIANKDWPCFWMCVDDAQKYKGRTGLKSLLSAMR